MTAGETPDGTPGGAPGSAPDGAGELPWERTTPANVDLAAFRAQFRLTESAVPYMVRASGPCPRCSHAIQATDMLMELDMFTSRQDFSPELLSEIEGEANRRTRDGRLTAQREYRCRMICNCGRPHGGRPVNEVDGCGAAFVLVTPGPPKR